MHPNITGENMNDTFTIPRSIWNELSTGNTDPGSPNYLIFQVLERSDQVVDWIQKCPHSQG